jgi:hypothetical protein
MLGHHGELHQVYEYYERKYGYTDKNFVAWTTVRHPCDWLLSRWFKAGGKLVPYGKSSSRPFKAWYKKGIQEVVSGRGRIFYMHWDTITDWAKFESLEDDIERIVGKRIRLGPVDPNHVTPGREGVVWQDYWEPSMEDWFRSTVPDFERFGY